MGSHPFSLLEAAGSVRPIAIYHDEAGQVPKLEQQHQAQASRKDQRSDSGVSLLLADMANTESIYKNELRGLLSCCQSAVSRSQRYPDHLQKQESPASWLEATRGLLEHHDILEDVLGCADEELATVRFSEWAQAAVPYYSRYVKAYHRSGENSQGEARLRRRPLIRIRYLDRFVERLTIAVSTRDEPYTKELIENLAIAKHRLAEELASARRKDDAERRNADLTSVSFAQTRHIVTLEPVASGFDLSHAVQRLRTSITLKHPKNHGLENVEAELVGLAETGRLEKRKSSYSLEECSALALCKMENVGRSLMFPPFRRGELQLKSEADDEKVVLAMNGKPIEIELIIADGSWRALLADFFGKGSENIDPQSRFGKEHAKKMTAPTGHHGLGISTSMLRSPQGAEKSLQPTNQFLHPYRLAERSGPASRKPAELISLEDGGIVPFSLGALPEHVRNSPAISRQRSVESGEKTEKASEKATETAAETSNETSDEKAVRKFDPASFGREYEDAFITPQTTASDKKARRKSIFNILSFTKKKPAKAPELVSPGQDALGVSQLAGASQSTATLVTTTTETTLKAEKAEVKADKVEIEPKPETKAQPTSSKNIKNLSIEKPSQPSSSLNSPFAITPVPAEKIKLTDQELQMIESGTTLCRLPARISQWNGSRWALIGNTELMLVVILSGSSGLLLGYDADEFDLRSDSPEPLIRLNLLPTMVTRRSTSLDIHIKTNETSTLVRAKTETRTDAILQSLEAIKRDSRRSILMSTTKKSFSSSSSTQSFFSQSNSTASTSMTSIESAGASLQSPLDQIKESSVIGLDIVALGKPSMMAAKQQISKNQSSPSIVSAISPISDKFSSSKTSLATSSSRSKRPLKERVFAGQPELLLFTSSSALIQNTNSGKPSVASVRMTSFIALPNFYHLTLQSQEADLDIVVSAKSFKKSAKNKVLINTVDYGSKKQVDQVEFDLCLELKNKKEASSFTKLVFA
ncbi:unnamed protein product [Kuraishia capsulata CBS 1993]|uniref:PH-like domain-containing protein n=1 Tax=Kuraishia capsulata CBS 1993 TaxID=1382522 RepID=W6MHI8_9ASCO|nr:uncharacterized protein KUCA_T00001135001 [Kuraishia capsulata CBS 1993]CDK25168.1 unnamed protein product [Kuraishia capsulata CBS 1993]